MTDDHVFALSHACEHLISGGLAPSKTMREILRFMEECQARWPGKHCSAKTGFSDSSGMELPRRQKAGDN